MWYLTESVAHSSDIMSPARSYLTSLVQSVYLAFHNSLCDSISDRLVVLSTHKILVYWGHLIPLGVMQIQSHYLVIASITFRI